jgi:ribosomal protein L35
VPPPDSKLLAQFPEYRDLAIDPARAALTIEHALAMTLGTERDELSLPYSDPRNSEIAMDRAPERYRYVLKRPVIEAPGTRWIYNGGATALLARLIAKGTGQPVQDYAQEVLFEPLGIPHTEWEHGIDGEPIAASGLRVTPRDLTKIGVMASSGGYWNGSPLVPAEWLATSFKPAVCMPDGRSYGGTTGTSEQSPETTVSRASGGKERSAPLAMAASAWYCCLSSISLWPGTTFSGSDLRDDPTIFAPQRPPEPIPTLCTPHPTPLYPAAHIARPGLTRACPAASTARARVHPEPKENQMPKLKTKSSVKKRFKLTATGKVKAGPGLKRHGLINRTQKAKRSNRRMQTLTPMDARTVKQWAPYGLE